MDRWTAIVMVAFLLIGVTAVTTTECAPTRKHAQQGCECKIPEMPSGCSCGDFNGDPTQP